MCEPIDYVDAAWGIAGEMLRRLPNDSVDDLREDLQAMGCGAWHQWEYENRKEIYAFLRATPDARDFSPAWEDFVLYRRLVLACYQKARIAAVTLSKLADPIIVFGNAGCTCAAAAEIGDEIIDQCPPVWPFDAPPPFPHWVVLDKPGS